MDTIGYCAVICPDLDFYQGYFIKDSEEVKRAADEIRLMGIMSMAVANPLGSIQALLVESALTKSTGGLLAAGRALHSDEWPYFYVMGRKQNDGYTTSLHHIDAKSVDGARAMIEQLPQVVAIKNRLVSKITMRDGQGRRTEFH